jgi:RimJ/RimL family protein N-acetyltransferase
MLGPVLEGKLITLAPLEREHLYRDGQWHDQWLGEVLRDEWEATRLQAHP